MIQDFRPGRWQIRRCRLSTSAITTVLEHDHGSDRHPARPAEGYPSALRWMRAASRRSRDPLTRSPPGRRVAGRAVTGSGADEPPFGVAGASRRTKRGSFAPTLIDPDTSCHDLVSTPAGEAERRVYGTVSPRARRRTTQGHPRKGCITQLSAKKVRIRAPEVSSINGQPRRAGSWSPQVVTNLWSTHVRRLYNRRDRSQGVDLPGESVDSTAQLNPPERTTKRSQRPQRFLR